MQRIEYYNDDNLTTLDREVHVEGWSVRHMVAWPGSRLTLIVVLEKPDLPELPRDWRADWA